MVAFCETVSLAVTKFKLPVPEAARPMPGFEFVQWKVAPGVPAKATLNAVPPQTVLSPGFVMVGVCLTVMLKFCAAPTQLFKVGSTVIIPVC